MINFRKPFHLAKEYDRGCYPRAIIILEKIAFQYQVKEYGESPRIRKITTQYKYYLYIDLWIFTLQFDWKGKFHAPKTP